MTRYKKKVKVFDNFSDAFDFSFAISQTQNRYADKHYAPTIYETDSGEWICRYWEKE